MTSPQRPSMALTRTRKEIRVKGVVQGVGFRPFVYNTATGLGLAGYVLNSSAGVVIEVEGAKAAVAEFLDILQNRPPPLAQLDEMLIAELPLAGGESFSIRESAAAEGEFALVPPDIATCNDCWRDFSDARNRRYGYAFTNCTNCGPRYTIIRDIPYDRPKTTMAAFTMCAECQAEYEDPADRRFHAQPNACPPCGPALKLVESGTPLPQWSREHYRGVMLSDPELSEGESKHLCFPATIAHTRQLLREGKIVAIKGLGGFLLACDAQNDAAVRLLRQRKRRSDKPFAVMARDVEVVEALCVVSAADHAALLSPRRPIVVLPRRPGTNISADIAPGNNTVGVMLPYTPLHYLLFSDSPQQPAQFPALVMTSGNISDEPIAVSNEDAWARLQSIADWFLFHNRDIYMRADDSVVRTFEGRERVLRRSRGYVPQPIDISAMSAAQQEVLACGAELKNTFCLTKGRYAILSQHIGDLENYETLLFFQETLANLKKLYRVEPRAVAYDLHPQYMSSKFARSLPLKQIGVQHHHAHIASCMAENHLRGTVIGVAFDGTGYGNDGKIWGGEFLVADYSGFERRAHLRYVALPGGDAAVRQPWRMALSYLLDAFGAQSLPALPFFDGIQPKQAELVTSMILRGINTVQTSSCGRLYDAVAALIGLRNQVSFEGQAAIELEVAATQQKGVEEKYRFLLKEEELDMRPMIEDIVDELRRSKPVGHIAACFHNTLAAATIAVCERIRQRDALARVCLSGGTFQNMFLLYRTVRGLRNSGFEVFLHQNVPANDGGISLGQAVIANQLLQGGE